MEQVLHFFHLMWIFFFPLQGIVVSLTRFLHKKEIQLVFEMKTFLYESKWCLMIEIKIETLLPIQSEQHASGASNRNFGFLNFFNSKEVPRHVL